MSAAYCRLAPAHPVHAPYHDLEYGYPSSDESVLFERLMLEINQAGLSWLTILTKRPAFRVAFAGFEVDRVAAFAEPDIERLLADRAIVRNRLKIEAAIANARKIQELRGMHGSFALWLDAQHSQPLADWVRLFRKTFRFTGGQIVGEFLMSLGYLPGAHEPSCPAYDRIAALTPPWAVAPTGQDTPTIAIKIGV
jgi:DNA-3-methyladenine glycosylase I